MESRHDYVKNGMIFEFSGSGLGVLACDWRIRFLVSFTGFFFIVTIRLRFKSMSTITTKHHNCQFLVLKRKTQHVRASFALLQS